MSFVLALLATASLHMRTAALAGSALTWVSPVDGIPVVVDGFSPPPPGQPWRRGNRGVDLAAPAGAKVRAAGAGVISFAGPLAGRGVVVIVHGDLRTTYEPVRASVHVGQVVQAGQEVGLLEAQPSPCIGQSCLHWGLLRGNQYLDPMLLLATGVRLLPQAVQHVAARGAGLRVVPVAAAQTRAPVRAVSSPAATSRASPSGDGGDPTRALVAVALWLGIASTGAGLTAGLAGRASRAARTACRAAAARPWCASGRSATR